MRPSRADKKQKHPSQKEEALCDYNLPYGGRYGGGFEGF